MKKLFKQILFVATLLVGMSMFVGCDMMTHDEIEQLINDKLNENSSNATADATPPVALAGTTWAYYEERRRDEYDEDLGEIINYEVYEEITLSFTETTLSCSSKTHKKEDDSLIESERWNFPDSPIRYYVQGNIIIPLGELSMYHIVYDKQENCLYLSGLKLNLVEE